MPSKEKRIQTKIVKWLNSQPETIAFVRFADQYSGKGHPDITGAIGGLRFDIEVKTPEGVVSKIQDSMIRKLRRKHVISFVTTNLEHVQFNLEPYYELIRQGVLPIRPTK